MKPRLTSDEYQLILSALRFYQQFHSESAVTAKMRAQDDALPAGMAEVFARTAREARALHDRIEKNWLHDTDWPHKPASETPPRLCLGCERRHTPHCLTCIGCAPEAS